MGKIDSFEYPGLKVSEATEIISKLQELFDGEIQPKQLDALAQAVGHRSAKNGAFIVKLGDLRKYGLIEPRNPVKITELGKRIIFPNSEDEKQHALGEAVLNVAFFRELVDATGGKTPDSNFHILLQKIGISREEAINRRDQIAKLYNQILPYLTIKGKEQSSTVQDINLPTHSLNAGISSTAQATIRNNATPQNHVILENDGTRLVLDLDKSIDIKMAIEYLKTIQEEKGKKHVTVL